MPIKTPARAARRRPVPILVAAVVQPVTKRLARMEDLLLEMRHEQDVQLKRVSALQANIETLINQLNKARAMARRKRRAR
jgi:hypothetical protein